MKRSLILFTLIVFSVVSCAGPARLFTKPDFSQDEYEKDREECIQSIDQDLDSDARWQAFADCLAKKGYTLNTMTEKSNQRWREWWSKYHEDISAAINPYFWADVILTIPVVLTIKLIDLLKTKESPKEDNKVDDE
jgi:hypothetical protein